MKIQFIYLLKFIQGDRSAYFDVMIENNEDSSDFNLSSIFIWIIIGIIFLFIYKYFDDGKN